MLATLAFTSGSVLKAPLALRGGMTIAGVEPEQVATGLNALLAVQGLMMTQNQGKIHEVYGVKPTPITELFTENGGGILVGFAIAATLVLGGTDAAEAVGYGNIPNLLQNIKDFVGGTADKNGWGAPAKFVPLVVNAAFCAALLGKVDAVSTADALKAFAIWNLANAVGLSDTSPHQHLVPHARAWLTAKGLPLRDLEKAAMGKDWRDKVVRGA